MAKINNQALAAATPSMGGFALVPEGQYRTMIVSEEVTPPNGNGNSCLVLEFQVMGGPEDGNTFKQWIVVDGNPTAARMGMSKLALLCSVVGIDIAQQANFDTAMLQNKTLNVALEVDGTHNRVVEFMPDNAQQQQPQGGPGQFQPHGEPQGQPVHGQAPPKAAWNQ